MFRNKIFKPKFEGEVKKKTNAQEEFVMENFGLQYREAKRIHAMVHDGNIENAITMFEAESSFDTDNMSVGKKIDYVKELSRLNI